VLFLHNQDVMQLLTPSMARNALLKAYTDLARGDAVCRPRIDVRIPNGVPGQVYQWGSMEGGSVGGYFAIRMKSDVVHEREYEGVRTQEKFSKQPGLYCGLILLTDIRTGEPLALFNDGHLQHLRVAADAAIGTDIMARRNAGVIGMLGSGGMARSHVAALHEVRPIRRLQVFSPTAANRERFAAEIRAQFGFEVVVCAESREVYRNADILAACTDSVEPVIRGEFLEPGMHVISVGGKPDDAARARFDRILRLGTAPAPLGRPDFGVQDEYLAYLAQPADPIWRTVKGGKPPAAVSEQAEHVPFRDVVDGLAAGRQSDSQITYSERGNVQGAQFYSVAGAVYEAARAAGVGRELPTDWFLQDIRD